MKLKEFGPPLGSSSSYLGQFMVFSQNNRGDIFRLRLCGKFNMVLAGALILPHGALIFDGDPQSPSNECQERYREMNSKMKEATVRVRLIMVEVGVLDSSSKFVMNCWT